MYVLVRALCVVKLTASDRICPHMHAAGRSRFAPGIGHHQDAERYSRGHSRIRAYAHGSRRALLGRPVTWADLTMSRWSSLVIFRHFLCSYGTETEHRPGSVQVLTLTR